MENTKDLYKRIPRVQYYLLYLIAGLSVSATPMLLLSFLRISFAYSLLVTFFIASTSLLIGSKRTEKSQIIENGLREIIALGMINLAIFVIETSL